jgi:DNA-binding response OmpR family regulator
MGELIIPWITDERQFEEIYAEELQKKGVDIQWLEQAAPALRQLEQQKVPLILLNPCTPPGPEYIDDVIASIMK